MVDIRSLTETDISAAVSLLRESEFGKGYETDWKPQMEDGFAGCFREFIGSEDHHCLVAEEGTELIGYVVCSVIRHPLRGALGEIERPRLLPRFRKKEQRRVAGMLIEKATDYLLQKGISRTLAVVFNGRDKRSRRDKRFWKAMGWDRDVSIYTPSRLRSDEEDIPVIRLASAILLGAISQDAETVTVHNLASGIHVRNGDSASLPVADYLASRRDSDPDPASLQVPWEDLAARFCKMADIPIEPGREGTIDLTVHPCVGEDVRGHWLIRVHVVDPAEIELSFCVK